MSIFGQLFTGCYPRVMPIRKGFKLGICIHHDTDPARLALAKASGFDYALVDPADTAPDRPAVVAAVGSAGLGMLGLQSYTGVGMWWGRPDYHVTVNEPNSPRFWHDGAEKLVEAYRRLKESADAPIIGGNLSWISSQHPEQWVKDLWKYGANDYIDYIGLHCYEGAGAETLKRYEEMAKCYRQAGFRQPFWVTEFGFNRNKSFVNDEKVARWTVWFLSQVSRKLDCAGAVLYELYGEDRFGFSAIEPKTGKPRPVLGRVAEAKQ